MFSFGSVSSFRSEKWMDLFSAIEASMCKHDL